ncbi:MAG: sulfotransferase [Lysobacterales bacterium]
MTRHPASAGAKSGGVRVPTGLYLQTRFFTATRPLWRKLADLESAAVRELTASLPIDRPLYVASLARSGTTIVTEMLEQHPDVTAHRYSDFPNIWTPYWRNYLLQRTRREPPKAVERAHRDRIEVSNDSPEAVEEVLWMHFFPGRHDSAKNQVLDAGNRNPEFDRFYCDHIRKLLTVRGASRYLAKGNYNVARMRYILDLFPAARFLVPVRDSVAHVASLVKQQGLFSRSSLEDPRIPLQLARAGHFEFGPGRRIVNYGDDAATWAITEAWRSGREVEGWARYWAMTYRHLIEEIEQHPELRKACLLFRYEDLCADSPRVIDRILAHCGLDTESFADIRTRYIGKLALPDYYRPGFDDAELAEIERHCAQTRARLDALCASSGENAVP